MKFINLTPHPITVRTGAVELTVNPSGKTVRVSMWYTEQNSINGIPVIHAEKRHVRIVEDLRQGLPEPADGVVYLVSQIVLDMTDRKDVFCPDTSTAIRDNDGNIVAVKRLLSAVNNPREGGANGYNI